MRGIKEKNEVPPKEIRTITNAKPFREPSNHENHEEEKLKPLPKIVEKKIAKAEKQEKNNIPSNFIVNQKEKKEQKETKEAKTKKSE